MIGTLLKHILKIADLPFDQKVGRHDAKKYIKIVGYVVYYFEQKDHCMRKKSTLKMQKQDIEVKMLTLC